MFDSIKAFISNLVEDANPRNKYERKDCQLATAALLTRVATVHSEMSQARRGTLHAVLRSAFGLDDPAAAKLMATLLQSTEARSISINSLANSTKLSTMKAAAESFR